MIDFIPSRDETTIAVEFSGKATKEDAELLDKTAQEKFGKEEKFNIYAVMQNVDGTSLKGMIDGMKVDAKRWKQYNKIAVISDKDWIQKAGGLGDYLPGIEVEHFEKNESEAAWEWLQA